MVLPIHDKISYKIIEVYQAMMPGDPDPLKSCLINNPIESIATERVGMWLFQDDVTATALEPKISRAVSMSVIPFVKETSTAEGLFAFCQNGLEKAVSVLGYSAGNQAIVGAALALSMADAEAARNLVLRAYTGHSQLRAQYETAFSYLDNLAPHEQSSG